MGVSGPDIITYIGVPLAVLGVLPIIYNTITTLATLAKVRRMLRHGRLAGIARGDVINHVIEIELPRYTIAPLHRQEQSKEYWALSDYPSQLPGGTWTTFNWKRYNTGIKTQRIDYSDQLRQPQAEIEFEGLLSFLLDLGAVPDPAGFRMLRGSGLWVPTGTALLLSPDRHETVLAIGPLDDSDGKLSLSVRWSSKWHMRDPASLPPYWVMIRGLTPGRPATSTGKKTEEAKASKEANIQTSPDEEDAETVPEKSPSVSPKKLSSTRKYIPKNEDYPPAIRCQVGVHGLFTAIPDDFDPELFEPLDINHLEIDEMNSNSAGIWFASALTALSTSSSTVLWNYKIPAEILSFAKQDTLPCGILVLMGIVEEPATPEWATQYDDEAEEREAQTRKFKEQSRAFMSELHLTPAEKNRAFHEKARKSHDDWIDNLNMKAKRDVQRAENKVVEAIQSPKWDNKLVAEHNLTWLKKEGHADESHDLKRAVEILLWRMANEPNFASDLAHMLDAWKAFVDNGGLRKADYLKLELKQPLFASASLVLALIKVSVTAPQGSLGMDLQECMRVWRTVRLG